VAFPPLFDLTSTIRLPVIQHRFYDVGMNSHPGLTHPFAPGRHAYQDQKSNVDFHRWLEAFAGTGVQVGITQPPNAGISFRMGWQLSFPAYATKERQIIAGHSVATAQITFVPNGVHPKAFYNCPDCDQVDWKKYGILIIFMYNEQMWVHAKFSGFDNATNKRLQPCKSDCSRVQPLKGFSRPGVH